MLHRVALALLTLCLALPALAQPVGQAIAQHPTAIQASHDCHHPAKPAPSHEHGKSHECIGCIARYDGLASVETAELAAEPMPSLGLAVQLPQTRAGPDTPPPRS